MAQLVVVDGPSMGRTYQIAGEATLGTDPGNTVCLADRQARSFDARIERREDGFFIRRLSDGHLLVNNCEVEETALQHGDMVTIGETMLLFDHDERGPARRKASTATSSFELLDSSVYRRSAEYENTQELLQSFTLTGQDEQKLALLYQFSNEVANIFDLRALGDKILEIIRQVFPADRAMIFVQDESRRRLVPISTWIRRGDGPDPRGSRTILREALKSRQGLLSVDAMDDERFLSGQSIVDQNIHSAMCVPLVHKDENIGVIYLDTEDISRSFEQSDLTLLNGIAYQAATAIQNVRNYVRRRRYTENLVSLAHATQQISSFLKETQLVRETTYLVTRFFGLDKCSILLTDRHEKLRLRFAVGLDRETWSAVKIGPGEGLAGHVLETGDPLLVVDGDSVGDGLSLSGRDRYHVDSCMIVPITSRETAGQAVQGVICVADKVTGQPFDVDDRESLMILANQFGIALHNADLYEKATVDVLTRVYVRRYLFQRMEDLLPSCQEKKVPLAVMMMDLDHFKQKNDTYGHQVGDMLLREMGLLIRRSLREQDIPARYGGEEFAVLLYDCPLDTARMIGERLRKATDTFAFNRKRESIHATVSIGISAMEDGDTPDAMIKKADDALYAAKQGGRNRVKVWGE